MKQIERIAFLTQLLRNGKYNIFDLHQMLIDNNVKISLRQIQRDVKNINLFLKKDEIMLNLKNKEKTLYYIDNLEKILDSNIVKNNLIKSKFYTRIGYNKFDESIEKIQIAINESYTIKIKEILNDETGDNYNFQNQNIKFCPIKIIYHRNSFFVGGWNMKNKKIQFFGIHQLKGIELLNMKFNTSKYTNKVNLEFDNRFGITKNIDDKIYNIKIEVSSVLANFIKNHNWHHSQTFKNKNGNTILNLKCGINRELIGWLFSWLYNIRIIEPEELKTHFSKTIKEIEKNTISKNILVYRNVF